MKAVALVFLLSTACANALDADAIRDLAREPHDRTDLIEELKVYPDAREYRVTVRSGAPGGTRESSIELVAVEKVVRGRYVVTEVLHPDAGEPLIMVVTYDIGSEAFRKWVLVPNGIVAASTGVADLATRTIAWISNSPAGDPPTTVLSIEVHSDDRSTWKETIMDGRKVIGISEGVAEKTR